MTSWDGDQLVSRDVWDTFVVTREPRLREQIVTAHIDLAQRLARRFAHRGEPYDDLVQVASLALIKAVDRFDPDRGVEFATYATGTVVGELKRHFRDRGWFVRAPRRVQELYLEMGQVVERLWQELGRSPNVPEIAAAIGADEEAVLEAMEAGQGYRSASIDTPDRGGAAPSERLGAEDDEVLQVDERAMLAPAISALGARNREIVRLRFVDGLTQSEIAERVGVSQMHVSRLLAASLRTLREELSKGA